MQAVRGPGYWRFSLGGFRDLGCDECNGMNVETMSVILMEIGCGSVFI